MDQKSQAQLQTQLRESTPSFRKNGKGGYEMVKSVEMVEEVSVEELQKRITRLEQQRDRIVTEIEKTNNIISQINSIQ